jgi:hypothetical protein
MNKLRENNSGTYMDASFVQGPNGISCAIATRVEQRFADIYPGSGWNDEYAFRPSMRSGNPDCLHTHSVYGPGPKSGSCRGIDLLFHGVGELTGVELGYALPKALWGS